jgi:hypothetical protein
MNLLVSPLPVGGEGWGEAVGGTLVVTAPNAMRPNRFSERWVVVRNREFASWSLHFPIGAERDTARLWCLKTEVSLCEEEKSKRLPSKKPPAPSGPGEIAE